MKHLRSRPPLLCFARGFRAAFPWLCLFFAALPARALFVQQIPLAVGWNAIHLEVEPDDLSPAAVFGAPEIEMVWTFGDADGAPEFIVNQDELPWNTPGWAVFVPRGEAAAVSTLASVSGGRCYLVKTSAATTLSVAGRPVNRTVFWRTGRFNLVGLPADPATSLPFDDFLGARPAGGGPSGLRAYQLGADGRWTLIANPGAAGPQRGRAYWIFHDTRVARSGPWSLDEVSLSGVDFDASRTVQPIRLTNHTDYALTGLQLRAEAAPLLYDAGLDPARPDARWRDLAEFAGSVPSRAARDLVLGLSRAPGDTGFDEVLTVRGGGQLLRLPLRAAPTRGHAGLWGGEVRVTHVSYANGASPTTPVPTQDPLAFRILLHVGTTPVGGAPASARLLKEVYVVGQPVVGVPGAVVPALVADSSLLPTYQGISNRQGRQVGYRLSAITYDFPTPTLNLTGQFGGQLAGSLVIAPSGALHPFRHRYHPEHDNLSPELSPMPADFPGHLREVWEMRRAFILDFDDATAGDPQDGPGRLDGEYREVLTGAHREPIHLSGRFTLRRINAIADLQ